MGFDFDAAVTAPFRMQPGLRRMAAGDRHLTPSVAPNRGTARHLREKLAVLSAFAHCALLARQGFDAEPCIDDLAPMNNDVLDYRGLRSVRERLLRCLAARSRP
jgi:dimethylamine monooxygenase subunit A